MHSLCGLGSRLHNCKETTQQVSGSQPSGSTNTGFMPMNDCHGMSLVPSLLTEVSFYGLPPPAPRWRGNVWIADGSRSSALLCTQCWSSWGRWWWCSWSVGDDGEAGSPAVSCSGARCCGRRPWRSAGSVQGPGPAAAGTHPGWSGGRSHSAQMRCI